jgi:hypothetical protein
VYNSPGAAMAETIGSAGSGHPNLNLTSDEKTAYKKLLAEADPDGFGVVSGDVAVKFFEKTGLSPSVLGEVWSHRTSMSDIEADDAIDLADCRHR